MAPSVRIMGKTSRWTREGWRNGIRVRKAAWETGRLTWRAPEGDGSGDGVKNTGAVTPVYASLKHTLFNFPDFELYMTELIYVFLVSTFAQQYVIFPNKIFIKIRPEVLSSYWNIKSSFKKRTQMPGVHRLGVWLKQLNHSQIVAIFNKLQRILRKAKHEATQKKGAALIIILCLGYHSKPPTYPSGPIFPPLPRQINIIKHHFVCSSASITLRSFSAVLLKGTGQSSTTFNFTFVVFYLVPSTFPKKERKETP